MANLRDIKRRIKSVKNTQQITKAMKMVSAAKLRRAQEDIVAARPYADKMSEMITSLAGKVPPESHPLFSSTGEGTELIIITSDRGLCGSFNGGIIRKADSFITKSENNKLSLSLLGRRGAEHFKGSGHEVSRNIELGTKRPTYAFAAEIARETIAAYSKEEGEGKIGEVYIVYSQFKSALVQEPVLQKVLPMTPPEAAEEQKDLLFEPSPEGVLDSLLPKYVEVQIFRALLESAASEHGARMTAMDSASKNASTMIDSLTLQYNRARQAAITTELMEIIAGAEALK